MDLLFELGFLRNWNRIIRNNLMIRGELTVVLGPIFETRMREEIEGSSDIRIIWEEVSPVDFRTRIRLGLNI